MDGSAVDRLPPHNLEAEQSVLGSLLIDRDAIIRVASMLKADDFFHGANGTIFQAIIDLYNRREPTDFVTLTDELQRRERLDRGGVAYLSSLLNAVPTAVHIEYYGKIVERTATLRRLINAGASIVSIGYRDGVDVEEAMDASERAIFDVSQRRTTRDFRSIAEVLDGFFDQIDHMQKNRDSLVGVPTGYTDLDKLTGGLQKSDLVIIAARPSVGKTAFALGVAYGAAVKHKRIIGIFSLEMSAEQLVQRLLATETGIDSRRIRLGQIDDKELGRMTSAFGKLAEAQIFIDDSAGLTIVELAVKPVDFRPNIVCEHVVIDYLQLMQGSRSDNRVQEISEISGGLKGIARELNIPVVSLSQLSRAVEARADHRPLLSDLRESGSIEQDADVVMFIYREELYDENTENKGVAEISVSKHRNGPVGKVNLRFVQRTARFADLELYRDP